MKNEQTTMLKTEISNKGNSKSNEEFAFLRTSLSYAIRRFSIILSFIYLLSAVKIEHILKVEE